MLLAASSVPYVTADADQMWYSPHVVIVNRSNDSPVSMAAAATAGLAQFDRIRQMPSHRCCRSIRRALKDCLLASPLPLTMLLTLLNFVP
jgi:hypothetical protein